MNAQFSWENEKDLSENKSFANESKSFSGERKHFVSKCKLSRNANVLCDDLKNVYDQVTM